MNKPKNHESVNYNEIIEILRNIYNHLQKIKKNIKRSSLKKIRSRKNLINESLCKNIVNVSKSLSKLKNIYPEEFERFFFIKPLNTVELNLLKFLIKDIEFEKTKEILEKSCYRYSDFLFFYKIGNIIENEYYSNLVSELNPIILKRIPKFKNQIKKLIHSYKKIYNRNLNI